MEPTLDEVRQELADIHEELMELPEDDYSRRSELKERQNELRQLSHRLVDGLPLHDSATLKAAYSRLAEVRDRLLGDQISSASIGDDAVWGELAMSVNKAIEAGNGVDDVEARLKEILEQLKNAT